MKPIFIGLVLVLILFNNADASFTEKSGLEEDSRGWYQWKKFIIGQNISYWAIEMIQAKYAEAEELSLKEQIIQYIYYIENKFNLPKRRLIKIVECESGFNPLAINPKDIDDHKKYGLLQWYLPTFYGAGGKNWKDWKENLEIGGKMMADGYWMRWPVCYKKAIK